MDPVSRRFMWDFISDTMSERAVILTTHSMEECEALCQRIGILSAGKLECLGSAQHLKTKFGDSFQLEITNDVSTSAGKELKNATIAHVEENFSNVQVVESFGSKTKFQVY